jgi:hypothetical protein
MANAACQGRARRGVEPGAGVVPMRGAAAVLAVVLSSGPALAQNESDWKPYFSYDGITFYYSPSTLVRDGHQRVVKWHDTRNPQVVFKVRIDCVARTIQSLSVDEYDLITGEYYETQDLSSTPVDDLGTDVSMGSHLAKAVC